MCKRWMARVVVGLGLFLGGMQPLHAQVGSVPHVFTAGTAILSADVNENFSTVYANALNRTGGTMTGVLNTVGILPSADNVSNIGSAALSYHDMWVDGTLTLVTLTQSGNAAIGGTLVVTGTSTFTGAATFTAAPGVTALTASRPVFTNGSKVFYSPTTTGSLGNVVLSLSPTIDTLTGTGVTTLGQLAVTSVAAGGGITVSWGAVNTALLKLTQTGTDFVAIDLVRSGGTASSWRIQGVSGDTTLNFYGSASALTLKADGSLATFGGGISATSGAFSTTLNVTGTSTLGVVNASGAVTGVALIPAAGGAGAGPRITYQSNILYFNGGTSGFGWINQANSAVVATLSDAGLLTVSGFGTHNFIAGGAGANSLSVRNTTAGTGNSAQVNIGNDVNAALFQIISYSSTFSTSGVSVANGTLLYQAETGGMNLVAAAGPIRFYSGGTTLRATLQTAGTWTWAAYGAGTITSDASGNLTAVSDERMKDRIAPLTYGLAEVLALKPIQYGYNAASGLERDNLYGGFSAQNVQTVMPLAVGQSANGFLTLQDRPILAAAVNAIKELSAEVDTLRAQVHPIATTNADPNLTAKSARKAIYDSEKLANDTHAADQAAKDTKRQKREAIKQCRADNEIIVAAKGTPVDCTPDAESKAIAKAEQDEAKQREKDQKDAAVNECQRKKKLVEDHGGVWATVCKAA